PEPVESTSRLRFDPQALGLVDRRWQIELEGAQALHVAGGALFEAGETLRDAQAAIRSAGRAERARLQRGQNLGLFCDQRHREPRTVGVADDDAPAVEVAFDDFEILAAVQIDGARVQLRERTCTAGSGDAAFGIALVHDRESLADLAE